MKKMVFVFLIFGSIFCTKDHGRDNIFDSENEKEFRAQDLIHLRVLIEDKSARLVWVKLDHPAKLHISIYRAPANRPEQYELIAELINDDGNNHLDPEGGGAFFYYKLEVYLRAGEEKDILFETSPVSNFQVVSDASSDAAEQFFCTELFDISEIVGKMEFLRTDDGRLQITAETKKDEYDLVVQVSSDKEFSAILETIRDLSGDVLVSKATFKPRNSYYSRVDAINRCGVKSTLPKDEHFSLGHAFSTRENNVVETEQQYEDVQNELFFSKKISPERLNFSEAVAYCAFLDDSPNGAYRLPDVWELLAVHAFEKGEKLWTQTEHNRTDIFIFNLRYLQFSPINKSRNTSAFAMCVSGLRTPTRRLISVNEVIEDLTTGFMWAHGSTGSVTGLADAQRHCEKLKDGGFDDWRVPSIFELFSILRLSEEITSPVFALEEQDFFMTTSFFEGEAAELFSFKGSMRQVLLRSVSELSNLLCMRDGLGN